MIRNLLIIVGVLTSGVFAAENERAVQFRVVCFEMARGDRDVIASGEPSGVSPVEFTLGRRLDTTLHRVVTTKGQIWIGHLGADANGESVIDPVAVAKLPGKGSQFLLMLVPSGKETGLSYHCLVLADDRKSFPPGGYRFVNFSPSKLRFMLQKQPIQLNPGDEEVVGKIEGTRDDGRFPYVAQYFSDEAWNRLSTGYWYAHPKIRSLQVVYVNPKTNRIALKGYDDKLFMRSAPVVR